MDRLNLRQTVLFVLVTVILIDTGAAYAPAGDPQKEILDANALFDRGRVQRMQAGQYEGQARQEHLEAARQLLHQADEQWAKIDKTADEELKRIVFVHGNEIKQDKARDQIHRRQLQARLGRAWVQYEIGQTYPAGGAPGAAYSRSGSAGGSRVDERTSALQDAGNRFDAIYDQQREQLGGFYARLGRGLCWKDLGESEKAFAVFEELLVRLPDDPADFHTLRGKAAVQALETALRPEVKKYKQGLDIAKRWFGGDHPQSPASEVGKTCGEADLAIRFLGGEAALAYAKTLPAASAEQSGLRAQQIDWARQQFNIVAAAAGSYQAEAKIRLLDPALGPAPTGEPETFADARIHAKAALDRFLTAQAEQKEAERIGTGNDVDSQRQRRQQITSAQSEVLKYCQLASDLRTAAVAEEEYDQVRYYLAYLRYATGELDKAADIGEALAQASSDSPAARQAARIGLAAREALLGRPRPGVPGARHGARTDSSWPTAVEKLQALAEKIIERWGNRAEADDARAVLLDLAVGEGRLAKAEQYLHEMSETSPRRGEAELDLGQALWQRGQHITRTSTREHDHSAEAEKTIARAAGLLGDGIGRCRKSIDSGAATKESGGTAQAPRTTDCQSVLHQSLPAAMLALAQIHITEGRPAEAIALLEDLSTGWANAHPTSAAGDSSSLALLAYVAIGQVDKAKVCLQEIQASPTMSTRCPPAGKADAARQMLQTCLRFRRLVKQYLAGYRDRRQVELIKNIVEGFGTFLACARRPRP